jgi:hypothetical protein
MCTVLLPPGGYTITVNIYIIYISYHISYHIISCRAAKRKDRKNVEIYVNNRIIEQVNSIKYLGIIFDNKMTFREHVNYIEEKCKKLIFMLAKTAKLSWGLKHEALKTIYTGGILPLILYGAPVWRSVLNKKCY